MKAAPFEYSRPGDIDEACALLAADDGARIIAGGQTLVPMMAMRLSRPTRLIDIARIAGLAFIRDEGEHVAIGATTRQCTVENDLLVTRRVPLLAQVMPWIGHTATRARGTVGGSLANSDPAAEIALVAATLDAQIEYREGGETYESAAAEWFIGPMTTTLPTGACLSAVRFPVWQEARVGTGFHEVNMRRSDFAFVSAAAQVAIDEDGVCTRIAIGVGAATEFPIRLAQAEKALTGGRLDPSAVRDAVRSALHGVETMSDLHASSAYRRRVAATLAARAVADAAEAARARGSRAH